MGFVAKKQKGVIFSRVFGLAITLFIASIGFSLIDTFWAVYIESFIHSTAAVGLISSFLALASFFSFFLITPLVEKYDKAKSFALSLLLIAISYFIFIITTNIYLFLLIAILAIFFHNLRITSFGIMVEKKSNPRKLSRNEGIMYTFLNIAWVIGPLIAGILSKYFGIKAIFGLSGIFVLISLMHFLSLKMSGKETRKRVDKSLVKLFFDFLKKEKRAVAYFLGGGVNYWLSLIYIFMPLYIIKEGLEISFIGYFLFAVTVPLAISTYYFSNLAGRIGFKKIFKMGFVILLLASLLCFFVSNIYIIMSILILASFGVAMLEAPTEAYFFDTLKGKEDLRFYGPYNTTIDINNFISRILGGLILLLLPFRFLFLFFSISMLVFFFLSSKATDINESKRNSKRR
jgi:MFS family permease